MNTASWTGRRLIVDQSIIIHIKLSHLLDVIYGNGVLLSDVCCRVPLANRVKNAHAVYFVFRLKLAHAHAQCGLVCKCKY